MARDFDATDDVIDCGPANVLDNLTTFSFCVWVFPDGWGENNQGYILRKHDSPVVNGGKTLRLRNESSPAASVRFVVDRSTDAVAEATASTMQLGVWQFLMCTYNGTDGPRIYLATPNAVGLNEVGYATRNVGSGSEVNESSGNFAIGNSTAGDRTFDGRICHVAVFDVILTVGEGRTFMFGRLPRAPLGYWPLWGVGSEEPDLSGNGNNGTVTGATVAGHAPIGVYAPAPLPTGLLVAAAPPAGGPPVGSLSLLGVGR